MRKTEEAADTTQGTQIILFTVQYTTFIHFLIYSELVLVIGLFIRFSTDSQCNIYHKRYYTSLYTWLQISSSSLSRFL